MALPSPIDPPISVQAYDVHYSEADLFYWHPDLIWPIPPGADNLEARVRFETDEFGFPNAAPLPPRVEVVVLGRSYSMGAQAADPWPRRLAAQTGWPVLNLSQGGSGLDTKEAYLVRYGLPRQPSWVILEILPSMDVLEYRGAPSHLLIQQLPFPVAQSLLRQLGPNDEPSFASQPIYPLAVDVPGRTLQLVFFSQYLSSLTVDQEALTASQQWVDYRRRLLQVVHVAREHSACVALLYVPTKESIYVSLAERPSQLAPILAGWSPWRLNSARYLYQDPQSQATLSAMQANASAARDVLAAFAQDQRLPFIDPTERMTEAALGGEDPFMAYDTHWSAAGHRIVAGLVAETVQNGSCPLLVLAQASLAETFPVWGQLFFLRVLRCAFCRVAVRADRRHLFPGARHPS
jgi:hypothetical protein